MGKKAAKAADSTAALNADAIPDDGLKLRKLIISNFGCIGPTPVEIDLDDIVILVGANNTGKSSILRAYDVLFSSDKPKLTIDDFPNGVVDKDRLPEIELHTKVTGLPPGNRWISVIENENIVRERWRWESPGVPALRQGFDVAQKAWSTNVPWGAANIANSRRPRPHRIEAFGSPDDQARAVIKLLIATLESAFKGLKTSVVDEDGSEKPTEYGLLLTNLATMRRSIYDQSKDKIDAAQNYLTTIVQSVFRGYKVEFDAWPEDDIASHLTFFKQGAVLKMGPAGGHLSTVEKQGSGARRTLMWAALKYAADHSNDGSSDRSNLLLLDEPELCLHPDAIREACRTLYDLPKSGSWQVMLTTHSPAFIDLSRDNTTVVRVERSAELGVIRGTTVFRPDRVKLSADEKEELKLLNLCDPHLCEFFFGGRTIIVEGDTEYTAFKYLLDKYQNDEALKNVHVIRARGKATICLVAKILNHFGSKFAVLHDSDSPTTLRRAKGTSELTRIANPAWTNNRNILQAVGEGLESARIRLVALVPHFEGAFFGETLTGKKPVSTWTRLRDSDALCERVKSLLVALLDFPTVVPPECHEWKTIEELEERWTLFSSSAN